MQRRSTISLTSNWRETPDTVAFHEVNSPQPASRQQDASSRKNKKAKGKPEINQRLLSDLIETYGEFAVSTKSAARAEAIEMPPPAIELVASTSTDLVPVESQPAKPALLQPAESSEPKELPAPEQERKDHGFRCPLPEP